MTVTWVLLIAAALLEPVWASALKQSDGLRLFLPSVFGLTISVVSVILLTKSLANLPIGTAYAVWVGIGIFGVAVVGIIFFKESASPARLFFLALILIGVIGLNRIEAA